MSVGEIMYQWVEDLFPITRSITGNGVRETLFYIKNILPELNIHSVPSGYKAFDWIVPKEWNVYDAYIEDGSGNRIVDFKTNNLHVVGYSHKVDLWLSYSELKAHLYSLIDQPNAIPYVTSYYKSRWGFCLSEYQKNQFCEEEKYHVVINSDLKDGVLNYADLVIPGQTEKEIMFSTYICHPSMANNELSGPVVTTAIADWIKKSVPNRKYTYRFIYIPETIGSIVYLSKNLETLKKNVIAGFNVTCIGDDRCYSYLPSRKGNTYSDKIAKHALHHIDPDYKSYTWLDRGSDERQYCSPGVDLPIASIMRSKYGEYPEYHTSLDNLDLVTSSGLYGGFKALINCIHIIENDCYPKSNILCEPQLGKKGLYSSISKKGSASDSKDLLNFLSYCDGAMSLLDIANLTKLDFFTIEEICSTLKKHNIVSTFEKPQEN